MTEFLGEDIAAGGLEAGAVPYGNSRAFIAQAQEAGLSANAAYASRELFGIAMRRETFLSQWGELAAAESDRAALAAVDWNLHPSDEVISDLTMTRGGGYYYDFSLTMRVQGSAETYTDRVWIRSNEIITMNEAWARLQEEYDLATGEGGTDLDTLIGGSPMGVYRGVGPQS